MTLDPRDQAAWDAFAAAGRFHVPTVEDVPEISTERAVFESLAVLLGKIQGRVEHKGDSTRADAKAFASVLVDVPTADQAPKYPACFVDSISCQDLASLVDRPVVEDGCDVLTDEHALWRRGEDAGSGSVKIFTNSEPEATALANAVREALAGNLDTYASASLPMPVRHLPPPFRDHFTPARWPSAHVSPDDSRSPPALDTESGVWQVDVDFSWRATRYVARPRIADFRPFVTVTSEPLPMFTRRFAVMPSLAVILAVSGVVIVDAPPPVAANAAPFGKVAVVGETEDGPFNTPTDLLTSSDQPTIFGLFGFTYGATRYKYPCAVRSGGTEPWNGNTWVQTKQLPFAGLCFVRVDTSVGEISLTPRAFVQSAVKGPFLLTAGATFIFTPNAASAVTVTFAAAAATHTGSAGTFTGFTGGETLTLAFDDGASTTVTFQPADTSLAAIIARINSVMGATVAFNASSQLRLTSTRLGTGSKVIISAGATATTLGLTAATYSGSGDAVDIAATTFAEVKAKIETASALVSVVQSASGFPRLVSKLGGTGAIAIGAGTGNAALGFTASATATAAVPADVSIPAGTRASDGGAEALRVVTMQTTTVAAGSTGTVLLKVRPAVDDGSFAGVAAAAIDTLEDAPGDLEWSVGNPILLTAALTASQLDSAYLTAIAATKGVGNDTTRTISVLASARQSNAIRAAILANAIDCTANGHNTREGLVCPPNGSTAQTIIGSTPAGVQPYRAEDCAFPAAGVTWISQEMIDGGYSTDGVVVRHPDMLLASRISCLPPGFNPGQLPEDRLYRFSPSVFTGLETVAQTWDLPTYAAFKAAGVCAAFFDKENGITFEQGVTTVNPASQPARTSLARRVLAGFIGDTLSALARPRAKRQATEGRREALEDSINGFLDTLIEENARDAATVREYLVTRRTQGLPAGVIEYLVAVTPIGSDDVIVFNLKVGANAVALSRAA